MKKLYLIKENKKTTDYVELQVEDKFLHIHSGKVGKAGVSKMTKNCGSLDKAIVEAENHAATYLNKGYRYGEEVQPIETIVFDKAKWHLDGDFPYELNERQAYVHTGLYLNWIIENNLTNELLSEEFSEEVEKVKRREITGSSFYSDYLDGVFTSEELSSIGMNFTLDYFDFEKGSYLQDYEKTLANELPTLYHVEDKWSNYELISKIIDSRYSEWSKKRKNNITQHGS
ncbi:DUF7832 domain-containing protein [Pontibacter pamirensis]|uniref:DUF7832 domain-containing protein n=1 Tax=Pontibacter pamirensis TaxID=2562824 RepID=UPI00192E2EEE|nr:WGR domain-containing protein [Pontibacter pamirensis]